MAESALKLSSLFMTALAMISVNGLLFADQPDVQLIVEPVWTDGQRVEVICALKNFIHQSCSGSDRNLTATVFKRNGAQMCTVDLSWENRCLTTSPSVAPAQCWCEKNRATGDVNYVYRFWADPQVHNGSWTCQKSCIHGDLMDLFIIDSTMGDNKNVIGLPQTTCTSGQVAVLEPYRNTSVCSGCK